MRINAYDTITVAGLQYRDNLKHKQSVRLRRAAIQKPQMHSSHHKTYNVQIVHAETYNSMKADCIKLPILIGRGKSNL